MKKINARYITDIAITLGFGGTISILNYLFNIYLARYLAPEAFGLYSSAIGIIYLVQIPAITIQALITQKVGENRDFDLTKFKWESVKRFGLIGGALSLAVVLLSGFISSKTGLSTGDIYVLAFVLFASLFSPVAKGLLLGMQRILEVNLLMFAETVIKFAIGMVAIKYASGVSLPILANGLPMLITGLMILPFIRFNKVKEERKDLRINTGELIYMFTTFLLINTPYTLDLVLVNHSYRAEYAALSLIGKMVFFACITIASTMFSYISNVKDIVQKRKILMYSIAVSLLVGLSMSLIFFMYENQIVEVIFKGKYLEITKYVGVYGVLMTLYAVSYLIVNFLVNIKNSVVTYLLLITPVLQIILFSWKNSSLKEGVMNQAFILTLLILQLATLLIIFGKSRAAQLK